jgi:hypothetical protein
MTEDQEWDQIRAHLEAIDTETRMPDKPTPTQTATAGLIRAITVMASVTWGLWLITWIAGMLP